MLSFHIHFCTSKLQVNLHIHLWPQLVLLKSIQRYSQSNLTFYCLTWKSRVLIYNFNLNKNCETGSSVILLLNMLQNWILDPVVQTSTYTNVQKLNRSFVFLYRDLNFWQPFPKKNYTFLNKYRRAKVALHIHNENTFKHFRSIRNCCWKRNTYCIF